MQFFLRICLWVSLANVATQSLAAAVVSPTITSSKAVVNVYGTDFTLTVGTDQDATAYYVVSKIDISPTAAEVRNGLINGGDPSVKRGSFRAFWYSPGGTIISGLTPGRKYFTYFILENSSGEQSTVGRIEFVATDSAPPVYNSVTIVNITGSQFDLRVNIIEPATVHYVLSTRTVEPSVTQVVSGYDDTGNPAFAFGSFNVPDAYTNTSTSITGLNSGVRYYVYSVAEDAAGNLSKVDFQSTTTAGSTCIPGNVTALTMRDIFYSAELTWTNPACFDEILVVGRRDNAVTVVPAGDGSAYTANTSFGRGTEVQPGQYVLYRGTGTTITATGMNNINCHFTVFARTGTTWSSGISVSGMIAPPEIVSVSPVDNSTNVPANQVFTLTFTEPVFISTAPPFGNGVPGIIFYGPALSGVDRVINRNSIGGDGTISISGNVATLTLETELETASRYSLTILPGVFVDEYGNDFGGSNPKGFLRFTTVTTSTAVNAPTAAVCTDQYTALGDIVLTEVADNNFQGTDNGTLTLPLEFNKTGLSFHLGTTGVTAAAAADGDIESVTVTSVSATQALFTVKFKDVANNAAARDNHDAITLSGLKVTQNDESALPASIVLSTSGTLRIQGVKPGAVVANITAGAIPAAVPQVAWPDNKNTYCQGTDLSGIVVTVSGGTSYSWYSDAALTTLIAAGTSSQTAKQLFGASPEAGAAKRYVTNVEGYQSVATEITLTILAAPMVDAGAAQAVCPQASVTLGGEPTASGGTGSYTYMWTGAGGFSSTSANPIIHAPENTTNTNISQVYTVVVKDENQCQASDEVTVTMNPMSQPVSVTAPTEFTYAANGAAVTLQGSPAGGTFSGTGVVQSNAGTYQFNPAVATIGQWPVTYTATLSNGCVKSAVQNFTVTDVVTGNEPSLATQIVLYPNPVDASLSIEIPENASDAATLRMTDSFGRETVVAEVNRRQRYAIIDTRAFATGVYIVRIETSNGAVYRRIVIAHN